MLWFFLWRTALWGAGSCALTAAVCASGALLASGVFYALGESGTPDSGASNALGAFYVFGAFAVFGVLGAAAGLVLGLLCGLVLFDLTRAFFQPQPGDPARYRSVAGWACAAATTPVLVADWLLNGYPDAYDFALFRPLGEPLSAPDPSLLPAVLLFVAVSTLVLSSAALLSGRKVAGRYVRKASTEEGGGRSLRGDERPEGG